MATADTKDPAMSIVVVTFKDEDYDDDCGPIGPVVVIRRDLESPEAAAAREAGFPFDYDPGEATDLGWKTRREAAAIAADHGVGLTEW
jgi:hypothetical protein